MGKEYSQLRIWKSTLKTLRMLYALTGESIISTIDRLAKRELERVLEREVNRPVHEWVEEAMKERVTVTDRVPNLRVDLYFVGYGYEARFFIDGQEAEIQCRDFGGSYDVRDIVAHSWSALSAILPCVLEPREAEEVHSGG